MADGDGDADADAGAKRRAADGTVSTCSALPVTNFTVAVIPGSSLPSSLETDTIAV
jgi:hypothetical protein